MPDHHHGPSSLSSSAPSLRAEDASTKARRKFQPNQTHPLRGWSKLFSSLPSRLHIEPRVYLDGGVEPSGDQLLQWSRFDKRRKTFSSFDTPPSCKLPKRQSDGAIQDEPREAIAVGWILIFLDKFDLIGPVDSGWR